MGMKEAMAGRPKGLPKTGGRHRGTRNRPKPIILVPSAETRALLLAADVLTPKAVMMEGMKYFYQRAQEREQSKDFDGAQKAWIACIQVAEKLAPYVHPRLLAIESRGVDNVDPIPFVLRAPAVIENSDEWQAIVSQQGIVLDKAERKAVQEHLRERSGTASGGDLKAMPHPAMPRAVRRKPTFQRSCQPR